jgi:hypothetical protein
MKYYRCLKCKKEFDILKQSSCCKGAKSEKVAYGMTMGEIKKAVEESNIDVWDWLFETREDLGLAKARIERMSGSIKTAVKELNKLEYLM